MKGGPGALCQPGEGSAVRRFFIENGGYQRSDLRGTQFEGPQLVAKLSETGQYANRVFRIEPWILGGGRGVNLGQLGYFFADLAQERQVALDRTKRGRLGCPTPFSQVRRSL